MIRAFILAALLASPVYAAPAVTVPVPIAATCETLAPALLAVLPGGTIKLTGSCTPISIRNRSFAPAVTLDMSAARTTGVALFKVTGLRLVGGVHGNGAAVGINVEQSSDISITRARVTSVKFGIIVNRSQRVEIVANRVDNVGTDGIRFFASQMGRITGNYVLVAAAAGGSHPDGIQLASDGGATDPSRITRDVVVSDNTVVGDGQGITAFQSGKDDGGYARLTIAGNRVATSYSLGMAIYGCSECTITANEVASLPSAPKYAQINIQRAVGGAICGNRTASMKEAVAQACPIVSTVAP